MHGINHHPNCSKTPNSLGTMQWRLLLLEILAVTYDLAYPMLQHRLFFFKVCNVSCQPLFSCLILLLLIQLYLFQCSKKIGD